MCSENWNADDEKALLEMQRRREEVMTKRRNVLLAVVNRINFRDENGCTDLDGICNGLIEYADAITAALKPFTRKDLGGRVVEEAVPQKMELPELKPGVDLQFNPLEVGP